MNEPQCNSSHSRLLGFFSALPGIWRALQCLRRYRDTKNVFPHLVNCGKYTATILYYMSLSLYRLDHSWHFRAFFIFCATINAVYCSEYMNSKHYAKQIANQNRHLGCNHGLE